jgi:branched-chain amino acid transport system permease protein
LETPAIFWGVIGWMIAWGIGQPAVAPPLFRPRPRHHQRGFVGAMAGAALGPVG